ncbi:MAG: C39 family peptidase [Methylococcaceae bacterium]|nr:C39 family peptidase [Methylococcaceae bacterium]
MIFVTYKSTRFLLFINVFIFTLSTALMRKKFYSNRFFKTGRANVISSAKKTTQKFGLHSYLTIKTVKKGAAFVCLMISFSSFADVPPVTSLMEMRRHNVVVQQWDLSCGAAALTTLLNYQHGDFVTEKEVANALMSRPEYVEHPALVTMRQGFSLLDLKRYVDARGYKGLGYGQLTFDDLLKKTPIIVPVNIFGYNHFVIFRGMQGNRVLLADPAWGNRTMLVDQFEEIRIDFPEIGKVGFVISRLDDVKPINRLAPQASDFVMTR